MPSLAQYMARTRKPAPIPKRQAPRRPALIQWPQRPRRDLLATAKRWMWTSTCKRYRLVKLRSLFGLPDDWTVLVLRTVDGHTGYDIVSHHRKRRAAQQAAERLARREAQRCPR